MALINCPNCGHLISDRATQCPACGSKICPQCGSPVPRDLDRCPECGFVYGLEKSHPTDAKGVLSIDVGGVSFDMVLVEAGSFPMGAEPHESANIHSFPVVAISKDYYIGKTLVTQALWEVVMGNNPSAFRHPNNPVEKVSWFDCQVFISRLNELTGRNFHLPTEMEWEFAARGGIYSKGYQFSGADSPAEVAWFADNSGNVPHEVASLRPNELGIFDMSGNLMEWCFDCFDPFSLSSQVAANARPGCEARAYRGGSWGKPSDRCRIVYRGGISPDFSHYSLGFRLALVDESDVVEKVERESSSVLNDSKTAFFKFVSNVKDAAERNKEHLKDFSSNVKDAVERLRPEKNDEKITVQGVSFEMIYVAPGSFTMGATPEMESPSENESPAHQVSLNGYYIGQTQVTQALWSAIMGTNPSYIQGENLPVEKVSWNDCQRFIAKLNSATGKRFRLPTEAEWEFAARGGVRSKHYQYSGSNNIAEVAWYCGNSDNIPHEVAAKAPNELGIYDMCGNVSEWCSDWFDEYCSSDQSNPQGPNTGCYRVKRGGSWNNLAWGCRASGRDRSAPGVGRSGLGFRLVMEL